MSNRIYIYFKPRKQFSSLKEAADYFKERVPQFAPELSAGQDMLMLYPFGSFINYPWTAYATEYMQLFLWRNFGYLSEEDSYIEIKKFVSEVLSLFDVDEWWYTCELLMDYYDELTLDEFKNALIAHGMEYNEYMQRTNIQGRDIWFIHDSATIKE